MKGLPRIVFQLKSIVGARVLPQSVEQVSVQQCLDELLRVLDRDVSSRLSSDSTSSPHEGWSRSYHWLYQHSHALLELVVNHSGIVTGRNPRNLAAAVLLLMIHVMHDRDMLSYATDSIIPAEASSFVR